VLEIDLVPSDAVPPSGIEMDLVVLPQPAHHFAGLIQVLGNESAMIVQQMLAHGASFPRLVAVPKLLGCLTQKDSGASPR
jgi:hypothetical protein